VNLKQSKLADFWLYVFIGILYVAFGFLLFIKHLILVWKKYKPVLSKA